MENTRYQVERTDMLVNGEPMSHFRVSIGETTKAQGQPSATQTHALVLGENCPGAVELVARYLFEHFNFELVAVFNPIHQAYVVSYSRSRDYPLGHQIPLSQITVPINEGA